MLDGEATAGHGDRFCGVIAVAIGADFVGELLGDGRAADEHLDAVADAGLFEGVDGEAHGTHGGCEEGGQGDDVGVFILDGLDELLGLNVIAEVDDLEAGAFEQGGDEVLADIVEVTFDGADDDASQGVGGVAQDAESGLHGAAGEEEVGHEELGTLESASGLGHGGDDAFLDDAGGIHPALDGFPREGFSVLLAAFKNRFVQRLDVLHNLEYARGSIC